MEIWGKFLRLLFCFLYEVESSFLRKLLMRVGAQHIRCEKLVFCAARICFMPKPFFALPHKTDKLLGRPFDEGGNAQNLVLPFNRNWWEQKEKLIPCSYLLSSIYSRDTGAMPFIASSSSSSCNNYCLFSIWFGSVTIDHKKGSSFDWTNRLGLARFVITYWEGTRKKWVISSILCWTYIFGRRDSVSWNRSHKMPYWHDTFWVKALLIALESWTAPAHRLQLCPLQ